MGWAKRRGDVERAALAGLKVVVDVQHVYRAGTHRGDRGAIYTLQNGGKVAEADCALHYALALAATLRAAGATVWSNDPVAGTLTGSYDRRQAAAEGLAADVYLACHLNAGGGAYAALEYASGAGALTDTVRLAEAIGAELCAGFAEIKSVKLVGLDRGGRGLVCVQGFTRGPALILEPLFGDHPEHQKLLDLAGLAAVGQAIANGVAGWWTAKKLAAASPVV